jgi:hypothetical protein
VTISFNVPQNMEYTMHTAMLTGELSGNISTQFEVIEKPVVIVPTGGTTLPQSTLPLMMVVISALIAIGGSVALPRIRRNP